jgi:prepilin-type N-terminal cleavage/methylation domain-containing protein
VTPSTPPRVRDRGFTLVELLIVIVILGVLATVTVFAVRGITDKGKASAAAADQRILEKAEENHMAKYGHYGTEAELVTAGLLRSQSTNFDIVLASGNYTLTAAGSVAAPNATAGTPVTFGGVSALAFGPVGGQPFIIIGGATAGAQWDAAVAASTSTNTKRMIFVDTSQITSTAIADAVHDASIAYGRVWSTPDDVANFSGANSMSYYMEISNGLPAQTYSKINDGSGRNVLWGFAY